MKPWAFALALAVVPALGGQPGRQVASIALYTEFQQPPPTAVLEGIQNELHSIMTPFGLHFDWRNLADAHGDEPVPALAVVHFKGRCDPRFLIGHSFMPGALGWTHVSNGSILPFSDVDCDGVRGFLHAGLIAMRPSAREMTYGRALGRVLAHELYHIFANTQHHSSQGVAKPSYTVEDLLSREFRFDDRDCTEMRTLHEVAVAPAYNP